MYIFKCFFGITLSVLLMITASYSAEQADIIVAKDGTGDFTSIQAAINSIPSSNSTNKTILVKIGTYEEHISIDKSYISLIGEDREKTIINFAINRDEWGAKNGSNAGCAVINIGCTTNYKKTSYSVTDIIIGNLTVENTYNNDGVKTMAIKDEGNSNRIYVVHCNVWCKGHDTISLWTKETGMYYHSDCSFRGSIDAVCPRGWCYAVACDFFQTRSSAPLWHEGIAGTTQKFVVRTGYFTTAAGNYSSQFKLLNGQKDNKFYILDAILSRKVTTSGTYNKAYFYNCHGESKDLDWFKDNLLTAPGSPLNNEITAKWTFDGKWDPENSMPAVLPYASLPQPWNKAYDLSSMVQLKWTKARNADSYAVYFGSSITPEAVATQTENTFSPANLTNGTYYWRVDAISGSNTERGALWSFTVGPNASVTKSNRLTVTENTFRVTNIGNRSLQCNYSVESTTTSTISISLFDLQGKEIVLLPDRKRSKGTYSDRIPIGKFGLSAGKYVVHLKTDVTTSLAEITLK